MKMIKKFLGWIKISVRITIWQLVSKFMRIISNTINIKAFNNLSVKVSKLKDKRIHFFLKNFFINEIEKYNRISIVEEKHEKIIWFFWYTGTKEAPDLIKLCMEYIEKNSGKYELKVIDRDSIEKFVRVPDNVYAKVEKGQITVTQLSDILRITLLRKYGGIWIDATCLVTEEIVDYSFENNSFFCAKNYKEYSGMEYIVSENHFELFFIFSKKNSKLMCFMQECFEKYLTKYDYFIDYFLINHIMKIGLEYIVDINSEYKKIPNNNEEIENLINIMNNDYSEMRHKIEQMQKTTRVFKLNRRVQTDELLENKENVYNYFRKKIMRGESNG